MISANPLEWLDQILIDDRGRRSKLHHSESLCRTQRREILLPTAQKGSLLHRGNRGAQNNRFTARPNEGGAADARRLSLVTASSGE